MVEPKKAYSEYNKLVWSNQLTYKTTIQKDHNLDALVGYEIDSKYNDFLSGYATNFLTPIKNDIANGQTLESIDGSSKRSRMVSYITRLNYDYKNKYYLGGAIVWMAVHVCTEIIAGEVSGLFQEHGVLSKRIS